MSESLQVDFERTTWATNTSDEDGLVWGIYRCLSGGDPVTIKGKLPPGIVRGSQLLVTGRWENDRKYGRQFVFNNFSRNQPNGKWGVIAFLRQADGIGETIAERIWESFGEDAIKTIIESPQVVSVQTPGLRPEIADAASTLLGSLVSTFRDKMPLLDLFKNTKISSKTADKVISARIPDAVATIKSNPFILMDFRGVAFKQCDSLRIKLKLPPNMPERIMASCVQTFSDSSDQTWLTLKQISDGMQNLLEIPVTDAMLCLTHLLDCDEPKVTERENHFALIEFAQYEHEVSSHIYQRINNKGTRPWPIDKIKNIEGLSSHQREVTVHNMESGGSLITLTGSPGTGKTYTLAKILSCFEGTVAAVAPTGKAAQRLTQALGGKITATTIHRLLEPTPLSGGGFSFQRQNHDINVDLLAVDEASMLNNYLAAALFRGISPSTKVILVGDKNQLPPIGPGTLLRDLQELPQFLELKKIERNSGMIVKSCASIRDGEVPEFHITPKPAENVEDETNVHCAMSARDEGKADRVHKLVDKILAGGIVTDPLWDVQFLTATHKNASVGREVLNKYLQGKFNPEMKGDHEKFKVGDKVICTDNCFLECDQGGPNGKAFVANGELGIVIESMEKRIRVRLVDGRSIMVPCGKDGNGWDLGYVITVHKYQGSEVKLAVVVIGGDFGTDMVTCREWLYTGLSRGKWCTVVICGPGQIEKVIKRIRIWDRKSFILKNIENWSKSNVEDNHTPDDWLEDRDPELEIGDRQEGAESLDF